jgi:hypothetical protein
MVSREKIKKMIGVRPSVAYVYYRALKSAAGMHNS